MNSFMDVIYQVGIEGNPFISIGPDPDNPTDFVRVFTQSVEAREHWGKIDFTIPKEMALKMGQALILAAGGVF